MGYHNPVDLPQSCELSQSAVLSNCELSGEAVNSLIKEIFRHDKIVAI